MRVRRRAEEASPLLEIVRDLLRDVARLLLLEPAVAGDEARLVVDRDEDRESLRLREREVLGTATRCDVHDARPFGLTDLGPRDDAVVRPGVGGRRQVIEGSAEPQPD